MQHRRTAKSPPRQQGHSAFRVRDMANTFTDDALRYGGNSPTGLNNSNIAAPMDTPAEGRSGQATLRAGAEYRGARSSKPFLEELFEDLTTAVEGDEDFDDTRPVNPLTINDPRLPSSSYRDAVRRQAAKPNILQFCVSTDAVPLLTTTAPISYTAFDAAPYADISDPSADILVRRRDRLLSGMLSAVEMRRTRDAVAFHTQRAVSAKVNGLTHSGAAMSEEAAPSSFYNEEDELSKTHLRYLLSTIEMKKREMKARGVGPPAAEGPWSERIAPSARNQVRREWVLPS